MSGVRRFSRIIAAFVAIAFNLIAPLTASAADFEEEIVFDDMSAARSFSVGELSFNRLRFRDLTNTTTAAYGFSGELTNSGKANIYFTASAEYYSGDELVAKTSQGKYGGVGTTDFSLMSDATNISEGKTASDIDNAKLKISYNEGDTVSAPTVDDSEFAKYDYYYKNYDVNIEVFENNTFKITETLDAYFNKNMHGIILSVPLSDTLDQNGKKLKHRGQISDVKVVGDEYTVNRSTNSVEAKIGNASRFVKGDKRYVFSYTYNWGKDLLDNADEFYWNIISGDRDVPIANTTFTITLPKDFDSARLGFSHGYKGSKNSDDVIYSVRDNVIKGTYAKTLAPSHYLTIRQTFDEGYFVGAGYARGKGYYVAVATPVFCFAIVFLMWLIFGRDERFLETAEFYPPEDINSAEAALVLKGKVDTNDVLSLLYYLAGRGYIRIQEGRKHSEDKIYKVKEYDGNDTNERSFMGGLFMRSETDEEGEYIKLNKLKNKFYTTVNNIKHNLNSGKSVSKYYSMNYMQRTFAGLLCAVALLVPMLYISSSLYGSMWELLAILLPLSFVLLVPFIMLFVEDLAVRIIGAVILGAILLGLFFAFGLHQIIFSDQGYMLCVGISAVAAIGIIWLHKFMPRRTEYGVAYYAKVRSFSNFIRSPQNEQLELIKNSDPGYFYAMISFATVFGVSAAWLKRIKQLGMGRPEWYTSERNPDYDLTYINRIMTRFSSVATSTPQSSYSSGGGGWSGGSSGGSSGGGSSGGGGGGSGSHGW